MASQAGEVAAGMSFLDGNPQVIDLRETSTRDLEPLLLEEAADWQRELDWDFSKSAALIRSLMDAKELGGLALIQNGALKGYGYCGVADGKGQIWDVYTRSSDVQQDRPSENAGGFLAGLLLDSLLDLPAVQRVECQLMLMPADWAAARHKEYGVRSFERLLLGMDLIKPLPPGPESIFRRFRLQPWTDNSLDAAARVLLLSHAGHVDSQISDQYRNFAGARRFLEDMLHFPGSSDFCAPASYVACDAATGQAAGICLTSFVAPGVAHLAELAVVPDAAGAGLGYQLLRQSAAVLAGLGARRITLTVTDCNSAAMRLYSRCGFKEIKRFHAYAWEKP